MANTKHSPDFIAMNGNFLTDFSKSKTGPDSVPSSPGALFMLILFRKLWGGNLGAESLPWGLSGCPWGLVSVPSLALWQAGMSICSLEIHLHWQGDCTSISLALSSESLGNALEPLRRAAAPQMILSHTREIHSNSVVHLCPHLPYPICIFSHPLPWIAMQLPLGTVPGRGLELLQFGRFWGTHFPSGWWFSVPQTVCGMW